MAEYEPCLDKSCLITIDTQVDTLDGQPMEILGTSVILPNIKKLLDSYRKNGFPIVHIVRLYKLDGTNVDLCRKEVFEKGFKVFIPDSTGCQLAHELRLTEDLLLDCDTLLQGEVQIVTDGEYIIYKPRWGAFYQTPLEEILNNLGVNTLVFTGANYPNCLRSSIYEASERDYRIILVEDAISGFYKKGKEEMQNIGVKIYTTDELSGNMKF